MKKTLFYFDLLLSDNPQTTILNEHNITLKDKVRQLSKEAKEEDLLYTNDTSIIQIETLDENHIFGSYGKIENLSKRQFTRGRTKKDLNVTNLESLKELVESYTYFYLDLNTNRCIILHSSKCTGFKTEFAKFLIHHFRVSSIYSKIEVANRLSETISEDIGKANHFASISYTYTSGKLPENEFLNFMEISGIDKGQVKTASVQLYLNPELNYKKNAKKLAKTSDYIDDFSRLKIDTETEVIDVIEKILSKKISIKIDEDDVNNIDKIKNILKENLFID